MAPSMAQATFGNIRIEQAALTREHGKLRQVRLRLSWYAIRLELAQTSKYPQGSPTRAYILHLPLNSRHQIDLGLLRSQPSKASVRRFWPNQADRVGMVVSNHGGSWAFSYRDGPDDEEGRLFRFDDQHIAPGVCLTITEPDGETLPYRIAEITAI